MKNILIRKKTIISICNEAIKLLNKGWVQYMDYADKDGKWLRPGHKDIAKYSLAGAVKTALKNHGFDHAEAILYYQNKWLEANDFMNFSNKNDPFLSIMIEFNDMKSTNKHRIINSLRVLKARKPRKNT